MVANSNMPDLMNIKYSFSWTYQTFWLAPGVVVVPVNQPFYFWLFGNLARINLISQHKKWTGLHSVYNAAVGDTKLTD